ncbi:YkgJ family cysteine cluster protein [Marinomonas spartinae]|uniref:YkgJ family cysteine cluster protein n=1 Tax=Marinomonas spartinae TaxID=1792290 RepID=UPI0018F202B3|nr:YkgJ family cysteine cluster protein [Marinomonas spartinae]MBJ7555946.1 YkgJ family cysteine cluster protein [Marinomonas spartinae]
MQCRPHCGACCIAPSISSPIPGMPNGKAAGERCIHLLEDFRCGIFNSPNRPTVCQAFAAEEMICGHSREEALLIISDLENATLSTD